MTTYTSLLGLALPVTGQLSGTWGDTVNDYITQYIDAAVAGAITISTDTTLTKTTGSSLGATSSQYAIIIATGGGSITITAPAASKAYLVINQTSASVTIRGAGPTLGVLIEPSRTALVAWDGSDFALIATTDLKSMSGILKAINGGTGIGSYTVGDLLYANTALTLAKLPDVATGNALISGGVGVAPSYGKIGLTTHVSGTLPVANGGTGATTLTGVIKGSGTSAFTASNVNLTSEVTGTLPVANGGTGLASYTTNHIPYASGATTLTTSANLTFTGTKLTVSGIIFSRGNSNVSSNIAIGEVNTLISNSTGTSNIAIGSEAMASSTSASSNVAIGQSALINATTGSSNVGVGCLALAGASIFSGSNNAAVGYGAGSAITTGGENVFIGRGSAELVSTGNSNILIGYASAPSLETGSNNIIIGDSAESSSVSVSNEIVIGRLLTGKGTQTAYIGGTNGAYNAKNVTTWETTSDERIKCNIVDSPTGLAEVKQLRVRNFNYRQVEDMPLNAEGKPVIDNLDPNRLITGFIAQELQAIMPECVNTTASGLLSVSSDAVIYALVKAVQELAAEVEALKARS
jgi:hypothetical protein